MPKPTLGPLYGAAFGFNTDRRVKPVHFATGFFLAVTKKNHKQRNLNYTVALPARKEPEGKYALAVLREHLAEEGIISDSFEASDLHLLRTHLQAVADNDDAVFPMFGKKAGFGSDYSASSARLVSRLKDNDGFLGQFVKSVFEHSDEGRKVLKSVETWLFNDQSATDELLAPLLDDEFEEVDLAEIAQSRLGSSPEDRIESVANLLVRETEAIRNLCENCADIPVEVKLRFLMIGLGCWVTSYLRRSNLPENTNPLPLLLDMTGGASSRMREQSRWSYTRFRETVVDGFAGLAESQTFDHCQAAWEWVRTELDGRPKIEEFFRELLIRHGLAQPRGGRVNVKHFELQPDTLAVLSLSVLGKGEEMVPLPEFFARMFETWGVCFGGRSIDADMLTAHGYFGLDEKTDLTANVDATTELLVDLGFAQKYSDGLVLCGINNPDAGR